MYDDQYEKTTENENLPIFNPQVMDDGIPDPPSQLAKYNTPQTTLSKPNYNSGSGSSVGSLICGMLAIFSCVMPVLPLILGGIGIFLAHDNKKNNAAQLKEREASALAGLICSGIGIGVNLLIWVVIFLAALL